MCGITLHFLLKAFTTLLENQLVICPAFQEEMKCDPYYFVSQLCRMFNVVCVSLLASLVTLPCHADQELELGYGKHFLHSLPAPHMPLLIPFILQFSLARVSAFVLCSLLTDHCHCCKQRWKSTAVYARMTSLAALLCPLLLCQFYCIILVCKMTGNTARQTLYSIFDLIFFFGHESLIWISQGKTDSV